MKLDRTLDSIPEDISSLGAYSQGVYIITSNSQGWNLSFINRDNVSELITLSLDSNILAHTAFEHNLVPLLVTISSDKMLRVYTTDNCELKTEKMILCISNLDISNAQVYLLKSAN